MTLVALVGVGLLLMAIDVIVCAPLLLLVARWLKAGRATLLRAVFVLAVSVLFGQVLLLAAFVVVGLLQRHGALAYLVAVGGPLVMSFLLPWLIAARTLRMSIGSAAGAWGITAAVKLGLNLLLALGFRYAVAEAFLVPTGAMAPAIYGAHVETTCANCGYKYAIGISDPGFAPEAVCPMCGEPAALDQAPSREAGDRVLADKTTSPRRLEIVVFKFPEDPQFDYIKRLVGLPGETVQIAEGDLFVDGARLRKLPSEANDLWIPAADTAQVPRKIYEQTRRWRPETEQSTWKEQQQGGWRCAATADRADVLVFDGPVTDELAYNGAMPWRRTPVFVRDVRVRYDLESFVGKGPLDLVWEFEDRRVTATITADGAATLLVESLPNSDGERDNDNGNDDAGSKVEQTSAPKAVAKFAGRIGKPLAECRALALLHRDGYAWLEVDGNALGEVKTQQDQPPPAPVRRAAFLPDEEASPPHARLAVAARDCKLLLSRIRIDRDVYYLTIEEMHAPHESATNPITLGEDEYFLLGDNSGASRDCRFFGPVKRELLVGVARWCYWPPPRWHAFE